MLVFDKSEIRSNLSLDNIFDLLQEWGGDPEYSDFGILSATICHNVPGEGSKKLYYYENSGLFRCYTGCDASFDIFELTIKVFEIQHNRKMDLNDAVRYIAAKHGYGGRLEDTPEESELQDWAILSNYDRIQNVELGEKKVVTLKEYDDVILSRFNYDLKIGTWLREGISQEAIEQSRIGFYPGGDQITIPHFDAEGRFVGLRGRTLSQQEGELYGKYRPLRVNKMMYNHPLGMNLYNLNNSRENIRKIGKAIIFDMKVYYGIFYYSLSFACF